MTHLRRSAAVSAILAVTASIGLYGCEGKNAPEADGRAGSGARR
ncbi:hypothetical protein [Glycomyces buryatensis]|nr:hypothetical protein [Glycomyces buryatensis]